MSADKQKSLWHDLASGAESGMDYSSRWFSDPSNITTIQTTKIIPAELNAYLYQMEINVADMADLMGNGSLATSFRGYAAARKVAINALMYKQTAGQHLQGLWRLHNYIYIHHLSRVVSNADSASYEAGCLQ